MPMSICDDCDKSFRQKHRFLLHQNVHSRNLPFFRCRFCRKRMTLSNVSHHEDFVCDFRHSFGKVDKLQSAGKHQCDKCLKYISSVHNLRLHQRLKHGDTVESHKCDNCEASFSTFGAINKHIGQAHNRNHDRRKQCDDCGLILRDHSGISSHIYASHLMLPPLTCDDCEKVFPDLLRFLCHRHLPAKKDGFRRRRGSKGRFQCDDCNKDFLANKAVFASHTAIAHISTLVDIPKSLEEIGRNRIKIEKRRVLIQCSKCVTWVKTLAELWNHERLHRNSETSNYFRCQFCARFYLSKANLLRHERKHESDRRFLCSLCTKTFSEAGTLKKHLSFEHGITLPVDYQCDICDKIFSGSPSQKGNLSDHIKFDHVITDGRRRKSEKTENTEVIVNGRIYFQCSKCVQRCTTVKCLRDHELRHEKKRENEANFHCQACGRFFTTKSDLHFHERFRHSDLNRPICSVCNRSYADPCALRTHMKVMHSESKASYRCDLCETGFLSLGGLCKHLINQHEEQR